MKQVRICWLPGAIHHMDGDHNRTSCGGWEEETREASIEKRLLCEAANKLYGPGSHWIERRDILAVRDFQSEMLPAADHSPAMQPPRLNIPVAERLHSSEHWRLMFA